MDQEWFFPTQGSRGNRAKAICEQCPVQVECDEYARRTDSEGVWAGEVRNKRRKSQRM